MSFSVDTSVLNARLANIKKTAPNLIAKMLMVGHDILRPAIDRYVSGPYNPSGKGPGTGGIPIPRVSKRLAKSIRTYANQHKDNRTWVEISSMGSVAPHNIFVHYGTRKMQARRFIEDPVTQNAQKIVDSWEKIYKEELAKQ